LQCCDHRLHLTMCWANGQLSDYIGWTNSYRTIRPAD